MDPAARGPWLETFMGLAIVHRENLSAYVRDGHSYLHSIQLEIIEVLRSVYGPHSGTCFTNRMGPG